PGEPLVQRRAPAVGHGLLLVADVDGAAAEDDVAAAQAFEAGEVLRAVGRVAAERPGPGGEVEHPVVRLKRVVVPEDADAAAEHGRACTLHVPGEADPGRDEERRALDPG